MTLTASPGSELTGEERGRFGLIVGLPPIAGRTLTFKVLQTYDTGEVERWIGPSGAVEPAPTLRLTKAKAAPPPEPDTGATEPDATEPATTQDGSGEESSDSSVIPIVLGIGGAALIAAAAAVFWRRRSRGT